MKKELIAHKDPKSPVSEIFRTLRTNIQFMNSNKSLKTLLVTSAMPGEGKSWVASNLSVAFAQAGKKVVLIDADMRKGRLYSIFGVLPRPGLSNYLSGINENNQERNVITNYLKETEVPNLYIIPAGNIPPNPSELLVSPQMLNLLDELKKEFDLVIIDATPSRLVTDAVILSRIVDSTIIVTAHNQTKKDDLEIVIKDIRNVGGNIGGVVYNKIPILNKSYNEQYYYSAKPQKIRVETNEKIRDEQKEKKSKFSEEISNRNKMLEDLKKENSDALREPDGKTTEAESEKEEKIDNIELPKGLKKFMK